jgi:hypothetical protein
VKAKYAICPNCGFAIDIFTEADLKSPVREKRLKYLLTRDQTCSNCVMTIAKCEEVVAEESEVPLFRVTVPEAERSSLSEFAKEKQYIVVTDYTLSHFKGKNQ